MRHNLLLLAGLFAGSAVVAQSSSPRFPVVDLGYARHSPTFTNSTLTSNITYATYSNIRFAQPPVGSLRFSAPVTPPHSVSEVQNGSYPRNATNCLQAIPSNFPIPLPINGTSWGSEDCLFLDVAVPEGIDPAEPVPVFHWLYGGGFFYGAKDTGGFASSLLLNISSPSEKFITVASNYRLGALGWMHSNTESSMLRNPGLYDAVAALNWTRDNIHRFGGDPSRVTVMGQSAGAGIIEHLIAADANPELKDIDIPFQQAVLSSPGYRPHINRSKENTEIYQMFLDAANCSDIACLRSLPEEDIAAANAYLFLEAPQGDFGGPNIGFGPMLDENLVLDLPERILSRPPRRFGNGNVKRVIAGGMRYEYPGSTGSSWAESLKALASTPSEATISTIKDLYGPFGDLPPTSPDGEINFRPVDEFFGEIIYTCHSAIAAKYYSNSSSSLQRRPQKFKAVHQTTSYRYDMSILPAYHGQDISYYFFEPSALAIDPTIIQGVAIEFQQQLRRFILGKDMGAWPEYSATGLGNPSWMNITADGFELVKGSDETDTLTRCEEILELFANKADGW